MSTRTAVSRTTVTRQTAARTVPARGRLPHPTLSALRPIQYQPQNHPQMGMWVDLQSGAMAISQVQADFQQATALGANCVRLVVHAYYNGANGDTTFQIGTGLVPTPHQLAQLTAVLNAATLANLSVWLLLFDHYTPVTGSTYSVSDGIAWLKAIATAVPASCRVSVVELLNEVSSSMGSATSVPAFIQGILPTVRACFPSAAITSSVFGQPGSSADGAANLRWLVSQVLGGNADLLDFYSVHGYAAWGRYDSFEEYFASCQQVLGPDRPVYIGEYGFSSSDTGSAKIDSSLPNNTAHREALQEFNVRQAHALAAALGTGAPLAWTLFDIPGIPDPASWPTLTQAAGSSGFTSGQVVNAAYTWTNSLGETNAAWHSPMTITVATNGNAVTLPALKIPFGATGLTVYVATTNNGSTLNRAAQQTGLVANDSNQTTPVVVTAFGSSGVAPATANTTAPFYYAGNLTAAPEEFGFGLYRQDGSAKPAVATMQSLLGGGAISTYCNGDFELPAVGDFNGVVQWPPLWRYLANGGNMTVAVQSSVVHSGTQALALSNGWNTNGVAESPVLSITPPVGILNPNHTYTATCWINTSSLPTGYAAKINLDWWGPNGQFLSATGTTVSSPGNSGVWTQYSASGTPPKGATGMTVQIIMVIPANVAQESAAGLFYVDDVVVG